MSQPPNPAELLRLLIESMAAEVILCDRALRLSCIGPRFAERLRAASVDAKTLVGQTIWSAFPALRGSAAEPRLREAIERRVATCFDFQLDEQTYEVRSLPTPDGGLAVLAIDVSERKYATQLRDAEQMFSTLFQKAPVATGLSKLPSGATVDVNQAWVDLFAIPRAEVIGKTTLELGVYRDRDDRARLLAEFQRSGAVRGFETTLLSNHGIEHSVLVNLERIQLAGEHYVLACIEDVSERRRAERQLRASENKFARAFDLAPFALVVVRWRDLLIVEVNTTWTQLFGYSREEAVQRTSADLGWYHDQAERALVHGELDRTGKVRSLETTVVLRTGATRILINNLDILELDGEKYILCTVDDVTEHRQAERRLAASERKFAAMFDCASFAICLTKSPNTVIADVNPAFETLFGYARAALIGKTSAELGMHVDLDARDRVRQQFQRHGVVRGMETEVLTQSGRAITVLNNLDLVTLEGEPYVLGTYVDITEQKKMAIALRESEAQFRTLADSIPQLAWIAEADGAIHWYNRRWYDYTGLSVEDMNSDAGWGWTSVHDPAELPRIVASFAAAVASGEPWESTFPLRRHDGVFRWHLSRAMPVRDATGTVTRWFGTNTDVQDQRDAAEQLAEALRVREEFLAIAGHELKTPLAALMLHVQSLERLALRDDALSRFKERLQRAAAAGLRLERLINELLDSSRIAAGRLELRSEPVDLVALVRDVMHALSEQGQGHLALRVDQPSIVGRWDRFRLEQAVTNLVENAIKYGNRRPIQVHVWAEVDVAMLRVVDQGIGIPREQQRRIFDRFERAVNTRDYGGLGLGLWITREVVESSGGTIEVQSAPGEGASFTVRLPIGRDAPIRYDSPS